MPSTAPNTEAPLFVHHPVTWHILAWPLLFMLLIMAGNLLSFDLYVFVIAGLAVQAGIWTYQFFWGRNSFRIYQDRIEYFNRRRPQDAVVITISDIKQVRYEDGFGGVDAVFRAGIRLYLRQDHNLDWGGIQKGNRIWLKLGFLIKTDDLVQILTLFQDGGIDVFLSTRNKKLRTALQLKNWRDPEIMV